MDDLIIERETHFLISDSDNMLFPATNLYPSTLIYPSGITQVDNIVAGSISVEKILLEDFNFGTLCSDKLECTLYDTSDLSGKYIYCYQTDNGVYTSIFYGKIESCKYDSYGYDRKLVAYDLGYWYRDKNVADWWENYWENTSISTVKALRDSLCDYMNNTYNILRYEDVELPNDNIEVTKNVSLSSASFGDMLKAICELNCCFPHFNGDGLLEFILLNTDTEYTDLSENIETDNSSFEEYVTNPITGVSFYDSSSELKLNVGDNDNAYIVQDNFLTYDCDTETLNSIGEVMIEYLEELVFTPTSASLIFSNMDINLGDYLYSEFANAYFYAMKISYSGAMLIEETITAEGEQDMGASVSATSFDSVVIAEKYRKITDSVEEVATELGVIEGDLSSRISQTVSDIQLSVTNGSSTSGITITFEQEDGTTETLTGTIEMNGLVKFSDLSGSGTTVINGSNITTGTINCDLLNGGTIKGQKIESENEYLQISSDGKIYLNCDDTLEEAGIYFYNNTINNIVGKLTSVYNSSVDYNSVTLDCSTLSGIGDLFVSRLEASDTLIAKNVTIENACTVFGVFAANDYLNANGSFRSGFDMTNSCILWNPSIRVGTAASSTTANLRIANTTGTDAYGNTYYTGSLNHVYTSSSKRYKHDIEDLADEDLQADKLYDLPVRQFVINDGILDPNDCRYNKTLPGFIAEEVAEIYPVAADYNEEDPSLVETWSERYIIPPMLKLIQDQHDKILELEERIKKLEEGA